MDKEERAWLGVLVAVAVVFNAVTLSPLVPWQQWLLWRQPQVDRRVSIEVVDYQLHLPADGIRATVGEYVEFAAVSRDVTYGLGVFRPDGTMVFQMQVLPGHENRIVWRFDEPGAYDIRSTEYSGPEHSDMLVREAINVAP